MNRCPYCGWPCHGKTCHAHNDLPALDHGAQVARSALRAARGKTTRVLDKIVTAPKGAPNAW